MLTQLVYASSAARPLGDTDLAEILRASRRNNADAKVTGGLLYAGSNFMQVLEGSAESVAAVYRRIETDARHRGLSVLLNDPIGARHFPDCPMAYHELRGFHNADRQRMRSLFDPSLPDRERARLLLQTLRQTPSLVAQGDGSPRRAVLKRAG